MREYGQKVLYTTCNPSPTFNGIWRLPNLQSNPAHRHVDISVSYTKSMGSIIIVALAAHLVTVSAQGIACNATGSLCTGLGQCCGTPTGSEGFNQWVNGLWTYVSCAGISVIDNSTLCKRDPADSNRFGPVYLEIDGVLSILECGEGVHTKSHGSRSMGLIPYICFNPNKNDDEIWGERFASMRSICKSDLPRSPRWRSIFLFNGLATEPCSDQLCFPVQHHNGHGCSYPKSLLVQSDSK
jgi:hypothetical protein